MEKGSEGWVKDQRTELGTKDQEMEDRTTEMGAG